MTQLPGGYDRRTTPRSRSDMLQALQGLLQAQAHDLSAANRNAEAQEVEEILTALQRVFVFMRSGDNPLRVTQHNAGDATFALREMTLLGEEHAEVVAAAAKVLLAYHEREGLLQSEVTKNIERLGDSRRR